MTKIIKLIENNDYDKFDINLVNETNYLECLITSIKYRSKDIFNKLIDIPNNKIWINKIDFRLNKLFETYISAPNYSNEYYIDKIMPCLAITNIYIIEQSCKNKKLFLFYFNKINKSEYILNKMSSFLIKNDNLELFSIIYNYLTTYQNELLWFNSDWIYSNILYHILINDAIQILKFLDSQNIQIKYTKYADVHISSLLFCLFFKNKKFKSQCFEFLLSKNIPYTHNLLWAVFFNQFEDSFNFYINFNTNMEYFKLNNDFYFDFSGFDINDFYEDNKLNILIEDNNYSNYFSDQSLKNKLSSSTTSDIILLLNYLIKLSTNYPSIHNYIVNIFNILDFNLTKHILTIILSHIPEIQNLKSKNKKLYFHFKNKTKFIIKGLKVIKYIYTHQISNYHSIDDSLFIISKSNKIILKKIILYLLHLKCNISYSIKNSIFYKKEINNLSKIASKYSFTFFTSDIKKFYSIKIKNKNKNKNKNNLFIKQNFNSQINFITRHKKNINNSNFYSDSVTNSSINSDSDSSSTNNNNEIEI